MWPVSCSPFPYALALGGHCLQLPGLSLLAAVRLQAPFDYTRKSDGLAGRRQVVEVTDASKKRMRVTIFMKDSEQLELACGMPVALRGIVELWQQREVALRAFYEGVTCGGVPEVDELAEGFRREAWVTTPVESRLQLVGIQALLDKAVDERVDVCGIVTAIEACGRLKRGTRRGPTLTGRASVAVVQAATDYTRKSDGAQGLRQVFQLSDASRRSVAVTIFMRHGEVLGLTLGTVVVVRGSVEIARHGIGLRSFVDGVIRDASAQHTQHLAGQWAREQWAPTPLMPRWEFISFDALVDRPDGARVDVLGIVFGLVAPTEYTRKSDGAVGWRQRIELCDDGERCVQVTVFLDDESPLALERGVVVALRAAKVSAWQGVVSLSTSANAVALDIDDTQASALRAVAVDMVEPSAGEAWMEGDGLP